MLRQVFSVYEYKQPCACDSADEMVTEWDFSFEFLNAAVHESKLQCKNQIHAFHLWIQPTFGLDFELI